jgi:hypothetical protein
MIQPMSLPQNKSISYDPTDVIAANRSASPRDWWKKSRASLLPPSPELSADVELFKMALMGIIKANGKEQVMLWPVTDDARIDEAEV